MLHSLIFDVDGTISDTEAVHLRAFNYAFAECEIAAHWTVGRYTELLEISGGKERLSHYFTQKAISLTQDEIAKIHRTKNAIYAELVAGGAVEFRPGTGELFEEARKARKKLAIATTTSSENLSALMAANLGANWKSLFTVINDASTVANKKPSPEIYFKTLSELGLTHQECIAFEDSYNGLVAASGAKIPTIITPTSFTQHQDFSGAALVLPNLGGENEKSPRVNLQYLEGILAQSV
ncbi:MAG: hypothetical protein FD163_2337 [Hyphomonadaceae bacterium]|nr:MAG: hypothetical protein FD128_1048 [Hyphomonadaceae bacterium]KAF0183617.1 MAG: hypothetical protein FD163_2337 [Hyphomonadaceae bacterium]